jgi:hypothetical protein
MSNDPAVQDQLDDILHPGTVAKSFRITVVFGKKTHLNYEPAVALAKRNPTYKEEGAGDWVRHSAVYTPETVEDLFSLFNLVHDWEGTEILVNHKRLPYGHQLWLPLMWFHRVR